jgi:hypothetical protein
MEFMCRESTKVSWDFGGGMKMTWSYNGKIQARGEELNIEVPGQSRTAMCKAASAMGGMPSKHCHLKRGSEGI